MYDLYVLQKIERGRRDAEEGRTVPHEEAKERLDQWLTLVTLHNYPDEFEDDRFEAALIAKPW